MRTDLIYTPPEIQKLRQEKPDDVTLLAKLAETQATFGAGKAAMKTVRQCLEKDPNNAPGLEVYAELLTDQIKMFQKAQDSGVGGKKMKEDVKAQKEEILAELKDVTKTLFKADPKNRIAITGMAQLAAEEKKWADAVSYWELLRKICPVDPAAATGLQIAYVNLQMPDKALAEMVRLDNDNQYDVETRLRIACAYKELGKLPEAAMQTIRAMQIFPYDGKLRQQLAALYLQSKQYDKALRELQVNCDLEPEDSDHYVELAKVYKAAGKSDKAREAAQQALKINPKNSRAKDFLDNK
jgi:predicted Zn-dependent protease